jgi:hypothetical protein
MLDDDLSWYHLAICKGMNDRRNKDEAEPHLDYFYEGYEDDPVFAATMDSICLSCPVRALCLREGVENGEYGLWGGVYLDNGKPDQKKNAHKTDEVWAKIRAGI